MSEVDELARAIANSLLDSFNEDELKEAQRLSAVAKKPARDPAWVKLLEKSTGDFYYFNEDTKASSWDVPAGYVDPGHRWSE